ncbi:hypothetical protein PL373_16210 [Tenacibaculum maritimum]|nr:hypothetical protein [Tenacibaculum maritimum]MDB0602646.1 hypothetical protein [Tenacibaculum maritimum]MDB0611243.1 hypothetical protein [Tenacibaculum maritimum]
MIKYQIYENQSLFDIAIKLTGEASNAFWLAKQNGLILSDSLKAGDVIEIPLGIEINTEIKKYYDINKINIATALSQRDIDLLEGCEGIECWAIGHDFIVSGGIGSLGIEFDFEII